MAAVAAAAPEAGAIAGTKRRISVVYADREEEEWPIDDAAPQRRRAARPRAQSALYCFRGLRSLPFWPPASAGVDIGALCGALERSFYEIRAEVRERLRAVLEEDEEDGEGTDGPSLEWQAQGEGLHSGVWLRAELWARGRPHARNLAALPTLARVLDSSSALMRDPPGRTYISLMLAGGSGGTQVKEQPHRPPHTSPRLAPHRAP